MRILFLAPFFYPAEVFGGPVRVMYDVGKELVKRGHEVVVFTSDAKDLENRLDVSFSEVEGMKVHYFRNSSMLLVKWSRLFLTPELSRRMKLDLKSFDIVHAHEYTTYQNIVLDRFARKYKVPYVLQAHGSIPRIGKVARKWVYDVFFGYRTLRDASKLIALTQMEARQYSSMGVREDQIAVIPNGIDLSEYVSLPPRGYFRKKFCLDHEEKIVLYLGRLHETKGLSLLANAFSIVAKEFDAVRLVVIGPDAGYAHTFSRIISDMGLENKVFFSGFVEKRDKLAALVDSSVFVTPSFLGFPVTFLEACAVGCPIVTATDELDWIHDNVGYVARNSPSSLAEAISSIMLDQTIEQKFRNNCRRTIKQFDISRITSQLEDTYNSAVKSHTR